MLDSHISALKDEERHPEAFFEMEEEHELEDEALESSRETWIGL